MTLRSPAWLAQVASPSYVLHHHNKKARKRAFSFNLYAVFYGLFCKHFQHGGCLLAVRVVEQLHHPHVWQRTCG